MDIDQSRRIAHTPQRLERLQALKDDRSFKHEYHEKIKERINDVIINRPQQHAKDLKDRKGIEQLLLVQFSKVGLFDGK